MGIIVDTCIFVAAERQNDLLSLEHVNDDLYISTVTVSELMVGVYHANSEARRKKRLAFVEMILSQIPSLDFTAEVAHKHAELCVLLAKVNKHVGAHDLIIAATAIFFNYKVLTYNNKEFERVPGLTLI